MRTFSLLILLAILTIASSASANPCANGQCPVPRWQAVTPSATPPNAANLSPRVRSATCRILHTTARGDSWGSGTYVRADAASCIVLTCAHLFRDGTGRTQVWFDNGNAQNARVASIDRQHDLAALILDTPPRASPAALARGGPQPGELVFGCGFGHRGRFRCQPGIVVGKVDGPNQIISMRVRAADWSLDETHKATGPTSYGWDTPPGSFDFTLSNTVASWFMNFRIDEMGIWSDRILTPGQQDFLFGAGRGRMLL